MTIRLISIKIVCPNPIFRCGKVVNRFSHTSIHKFNEIHSIQLDEELRLSSQFDGFWSKYGLLPSSRPTMNKYAYGARTRVR